MIDLNCFPNTTMSIVSNSLVCLTLLWSSLCLRLLSNTKMFNRDTSSKWSKDFCLSELPYLDFFGDNSIGNGKYMMIATTDRVNLGTYTEPELKVYNAKKYSFQPLTKADPIHWIYFMELVKVTINTLYLIYLFFPLSTLCTGISKVSWKLSLNIPEKVHLNPQQ